MIIIVEGPDGSGKTTLAKKLADAFGYEYVHFGVPEDDSILFDERIQYIKDVDNVVIDRFWLSDLIYGKIMRGVNVYSSIEQILLNSLCNRKGILIYCNGDADKLWEKCQERGEDYVTSELMYLKIHTMYRRQMELLQNMGFPVHEVRLVGEDK